jgi:tRNA threonylcarbamoyladenosine biosynthesis protein TsaB
LLRPEELQVAPATTAVAGNVFAVYGERLPGLAAAGGVPRITALPSAAALLRLAPQWLAQGKAVPAAQALPMYIRDKVAKTTEERAAEKATAQAVLAAQTAATD